MKAKILQMFDGELQPLTTRQIARLLVDEHHRKRQPQAKPQQGEIPVLRTPVLQSDAERGEGDSINSRLHRLIRGAK